MDLQLQIIGFSLILLGCIHIIFPKQFKWKQELSGLSIMNREMMYVHTFFIAFTLLLVGILCVTSAPLLTSTDLGKRICLGLGIFWTVRFFVQFFGYSSETWRGKRIETVVHIIFAFFWFYISVVFMWVYFG